jgi:predicted TIM-barrel fold metal-dependent hydrolase
VHEQRRVFDADAHVVEPFDLFTDWVTPGTLPVDLPATTPMVPCGDAGRVADQLAARFDGPSYLRAMDVEGIDACVLYPSQGLFAPFQPGLDAAESARACRAYNDWVAGYCSVDPRRLFASAVVPLADPRIAADEVRRAAGLGLVAVLVRPNHLYSRNLGDAAYDQLYDAVEETHLVLAVHEGLGLRGPTAGSDRFRSFTERHACSHPMEQMMAMASLVVGGALERHATMRVAYLESGTGWLPYWMSRLDGHVEWMAAEECAHLSLKPSQYFARQCVISTDSDDELAAWVTERVGGDHVMWASDFPHPDALYPHAVTTFVAEMSETGMSDDALEAVLWTTPIDLYRLGDRVMSPAT